jgi:hypothetical protein
MSFTRARRHSPALICIVGLLMVMAVPAAAQEPADPNPGAISITGAMDFTNAYYFRGIPQDESGVIMWPYFDLGLALYSGDGGLKSVGVNIGTWNSLHTGDFGSDGPTEKLWYESDFYATLGLGFGGGTSLGVTYTAYTSPNGLFSTVKEIAFKFSLDDSGYLGKAAVKPYLLLARELDSDGGQADGGRELGTYLELGVAPGYAIPRATFTLPVKVGLSVSDYYEGVDGDETFGYFSIAGQVAVPFTSAPTKFGSWNLHGGVEYLRLGDRNQSLGENNVIGTIGIGFSY